MIAFIDDHRGAYGVEPICEVLPIAPSTYHTHGARRADPSRLPARAKRDASLRPEIARVLAESDATTEDDMADFLDVAQYATMMAPSYTIQGGTTQVLRGIVARGLGLR